MARGIDIFADSSGVKREGGVKGTWKGGLLVKGLLLLYNREKMVVSGVCWTKWMIWDVKKELW